MFSTILLSAAMAIACISCIVACWMFVLARNYGRYARMCYDAMQENTIEAISSSKIAELERSLTELWDSHTSLLASHKRLRSKYGMRDMRERKKELENGQDAAPALDNSSTDAEKAAYKANLRRQCKERGLLR